MLSAMPVTSRGVYVSLLQPERLLLLLYSQDSILRLLHTFHLLDQLRTAIALPILGPIFSACTHALASTIPFHVYAHTPEDEILLKKDV